MNFIDLACKYELVDADNLQEKLMTFTDPSDNDAVVVRWLDEEDEATFDHDAVVNYFENGDFGVADREGNMYTFSAYFTTRVPLSEDNGNSRLAPVLLENADTQQLKDALEAKGLAVILWAPEDFPSQAAFELHVDTVIDICISRGNDAIGDLCPDDED